MWNVKKCIFNVTKQFLNNQQTLQHFWTQTETLNARLSFSSICLMGTLIFFSARNSNHKRLTFAPAFHSIWIEISSFNAHKTVKAVNPQLVKENRRPKHRSSSRLHCCCTCAKFLTFRGFCSALSAKRHSSVLRAFICYGVHLGLPPRSPTQTSDVWSAFVHVHKITTRHFLSRQNRHKQST